MTTNESTIDLTKKKGTIGNVMMAHRDELLSVKSSAEAYAKLKALFEENGINTPKSRQILMNLQTRNMGYTQTVLYLNAIIMKSQGMGVIESEEEEKEEDLQISFFSCADLIIKDAPKDADLKIFEIPVSIGGVRLSNLPVNINDNDIKVRRF